MKAQNNTKKNGVGCADGSGFCFHDFNVYIIFCNIRLCGYIAFCGVALQNPRLFQKLQVNELLAKDSNYQVELVKFTDYAAPNS